MKTGKKPSFTICNDDLLLSAFNVGIRLAKENGHVYPEIEASEKPDVEKMLREAHCLIAEMLDCIVSGKGNWNSIEQRAVNLINK